LFVHRHQQTIRYIVSFSKCMCDNNTPMLEITSEMGTHS